MAKKTASSAQTKASTSSSASSRSGRLGLTFPISRYERSLRAAHGGRCNSKASVALTFYVESIAKSILHAASEQSRSEGHKRITAENVLRGVRGDTDLAYLFKNNPIYLSGSISSRDISKVVRPEALYPRK
jgi:histone H3/H4